MQREHGGPDTAGAARWDFSTNANACGPCPVAFTEVRDADATRYPDPRYTALRERLAALHGVAPWRVVLAGSASEFVMRLTALVALRAPGPVCVPLHAYGDYAAAARAFGLPVVVGGAEGGLHWHCDPSTPLGAATSPPPRLAEGVHVLDRAYEPLRLEGECAWAQRELDGVFQMFSPNKALGLTGVRAAYAIAPRAGEHWTQALEAAAPSWPVGAHGVAMLNAWCEASVQTWVVRSRHRLAEWKGELMGLLASHGIGSRPSVTPYFCADWPADLPLQTLRSHGIKLRDVTSFGLPGWVRLSAQPPEAQRALESVITVLCQGPG